MLVYRECECVVAHQGHRAEVAQGVERHEQRARRDGRVELRQGYAKERAPSAVSEAARGFVGGGVKVGYRAAHGQEHIRVAEQRQNQRRARKPVEVGDALDAKRRLQQRLQHPAGA